MSDWLLARTYGSGAAGVRLLPEPCGLPVPDPWAPGRALRSLAAELRVRGILASLAAALRLVPALTLGVVLVLAVFITASRERLDSADLQIVRFEPAPTPQPSVPPESQAPLASTLAELAPPPLAEIAPPPEPVTPPPPPVRDVRPVPLPRLAETPPPQPGRVPAAPRAPRPSLPPAPELAERVTPALPVPSTRSLPAAPARARPEVRIDGLARASVPPAQARASRAEPRGVASGALRPRPELALPASPATASRPEVGAAMAAGSRPVPRPAARARTPRPERLQVAALPGAAREPRPDPTGSGRVTRTAPSQPSGGGAQQPRLSGVALGSLAACVSDRREDELKQRVMAERGDAGECTSEAGRYRFVETRNLNAFLMWVERAPTRREADRCVELSLALDCLADSRRRSREI